MPQRPPALSEEIVSNNCANAIRSACGEAVTCIANGVTPFESVLKMPGCRTHSHLMIVADRSSILASLQIRRQSNCQ